MSQASSYLCLHAIDNLLLSSGALYHAHIVLYTNDIEPNPGTLLIDLDQPTTVSGYASQLVTWSSPEATGDGGYRTIGNVSSFAGDVDNPVTIKGWALVFQISGTPLLLTENFETPIQLASVSDTVDIVPVFTMPGDGDYGFSVLI